MQTNPISVGLPASPNVHKAHDNVMFEFRVVADVGKRGPLTKGPSPVPYSSQEQGSVRASVRSWKRKACVVGVSTRK